MSVAAQVDPTPAPTVTVTTTAKPKPAPTVTVTATTTATPAPGPTVTVTATPVPEPTPTDITVSPTPTVTTTVTAAPVPVPNENDDATTSSPAVILILAVIALALIAGVLTLWSMLNNRKNALKTLAQTTALNSATYVNDSFAVRQSSQVEPIAGVVGKADHLGETADALSVHWADVSALSGGKLDNNDVYANLSRKVGVHRNAMAAWADSLVAKDVNATAVAAGLAETAESDLVTALAASFPDAVKPSSATK